MVITNGKITECTDSELYDYWLDRLDSICSFNEFKAACIRHGTEVTESTAARCPDFRSRYCYNYCNWFETCPELEEDDKRNGRP